MRPVGFTTLAALLTAAVVGAQPPAAPGPVPGAPPAPGTPGAAVPPGAPGVPTVGPPGAPGAPAAGQPGVPMAPPPAPPAAPDPKLDTHLGGWEKKMGDLVNFHATFELQRTENTAFKKQRNYTGMVLCMKPNYARLRIEDPANKNDYEAYICNGKFLYHYDGVGKTITEFPLNPNPGAAGGDNLMLDFLAGMKAKDVKQRFQISLFNEDDHYVYFDIKPILGKDRQEFEQVRFALFGPRTKFAYLPAQVYLVKPNGDAEMWKFAPPSTNIPGIEAKHFAAEQIQGFEFKRAPAPGPMGPAPMPPGGPAGRPAGVPGKP